MNGETTVATLSHRSQKTRMLSTKSDNGWSREIEAESMKLSEYAQSLRNTEVDQDAIRSPPQHQYFGFLDLRQIIGMVVATVLAITFGSIPLSEKEGRDQAHTMLAVSAFVACFWVFEVLPLPISGLLPIVLIPMAGLASTGEAARWFWGPLQMMMIGAFFKGLKGPPFGLM